MPLPLRCRCESPHWEIHVNKIKCANPACGFTEFFEPSKESIINLVSRMKMEGAYYLDKDKDKLRSSVQVQVRGHLYR